MSRWEQLGQELAQKLEGVTDESTVKQLAQDIVNQIRAAYPEKPNSRKTPLNHVRKAIKAAFPDTEIQEYPCQNFTNSGKRNIDRWEHLALKYLTLSTEEWDEMGDDARKQWKAQQQAQKEQQQPETTPTQTLETMNISQLELDADTQKVVEDAIAHSGMSLADFVKKACLVYAKTVTGKVKQADEDLTPVSTEDLMSEKFKTHPGRAEELTRRAIYALEVHNNNCTEKSQKWHINQTAIQTLTGSKPATIKKILENYKTRLDDHNAKHELNTYDNRKPEIKINEAIDLMRLVPNGCDIF